jgi:electron transport complex protein RnfE
MGERSRDVLLAHNPALVQLLGLSPLLAIARNATLGLATGAVCAMTLLIAAQATQRLSGVIAPAHRSLAALMIAAGVVTMLDLLLELTLPALRVSMSVYMPLVAGNCVIVHALCTPRPATASSPAPHDEPAPPPTPFAVAVGFAGLALVLGSARELIGAGTLFADLSLLAPGLSGLTLLPAGTGFRLALLPPGAFFALATVLAVRRMVLSRRDGRTPTRATGTGGDDETANER